MHGAIQTTTTPPSCAARRGRFPLLQTDAAQGKDTGDEHGTDKNDDGDGVGTQVIGGYRAGTGFFVADAAPVGDVGGALGRQQGAPEFDTLGDGNAAEEQRTDGHRDAQDRRYDKGDCKENGEPPVARWQLELHRWTS